MNHVQAKFSDDGASVVVSFSLDGSESSGLLDASDPNSGSGPGSCDALFNASTQSVIGDGATCEYIAHVCLRSMVTNAS